MSERNASEEAEGQHKAGHARLFLYALIAYTLLPVFGIGTQRNASGDKLFQLWYLIGYLVVSFFLIHELVMPMPPKEHDGQKA